eukprot:m.115117 g.115117  ORF g.115117 m.115117 type:complete len:221 (-) comp16043_c0_seq2:366-1028(-)
MVDTRGTDLASLGTRLQLLGDECEWLEHRLHQAVAAASYGSENASDSAANHATAGRILQDVEKLDRSFEGLLQLAALHGRFERGHLFSFFSDMTADFADRNMPALLEEQDDIISSMGTVSTLLRKTRSELEAGVLACGQNGHPCGMGHSEQQGDDVCQLRLSATQLSDITTQISRLRVKLEDLVSTVNGHLFHVRSVTSSLWRNLPDAQRDLWKDYPKQY